MEKISNTANLKQDILEKAQHKIYQYDQAVAAARANNDRHDEGVQLINLGKACFNLGQVKRAIECYEQALSIFGELGDQREEANCHTHLGVAYLLLRDAKNIHFHHVQACSIYDKIGDRGRCSKRIM